jgi:hypothetical protein
LWGPAELTAAPQAWTQEGQWLEVPVKRFILENSVVWVVFQWLPDTPTAPLIGLSTTPVNHNSYFAQHNGDLLDWQSYNYGNLMINLSLLTNYDQLNADVPVDSFVIYRSTDSTLLLAQESRIASLPADSFRFLDSNLSNGQSYYYAITSAFQNQESLPQVSGLTIPRSGAKLSLSSNWKLLDLPPDSLMTDMVILSNLGDLPAELTYKVRLKDTMGNQISDNSGYTWISNLDSAGLQFNWIDIEQDLYLIVSSNGDDKNWGPFPLSTSFPFYGNSFDSIRICSNGFASFTSPSIKTNNRPLPDLSGQFNLLAAFWDDLFLNDSSRIYFKSWDDSHSGQLLFSNYSHRGRGPCLPIFEPSGCSGLCHGRNSEPRWLLRLTGNT